MRGARGRAGHRQDAAARRAARSCRGAGLPCPVGLGDRVRARSAVQRLGRRARRVRRLARAEPARGVGPDAVGELADVLPSLRARAGRPQASVADERYRAHRAVRKLLELLAAERPLVLVLDDLHWSDGASIELLAALLRREPEAPVLLALAFRPGRRPRGCRPRSRAPSVRRIELAQLSEAEAAAAPRWARRAGGGGDLPARRRQPLLPRAARARRRATVLAALAASGASVDAVGVPRPSPRRSPTSSTSLRPAERRLLEAAAVAGEPFEPDLAARSPSCRPPMDSRARRAARRSTSCARPRCRGASSSAIRSCGERSTSRRRGGWRLAAHARAADGARRPRAPRAAERAHHVEQSAEQGDEEAIAAPARGGRRRLGARSGRRGALVRGRRCDCFAHRHGTPGRRPRRARVGPARRSASSSAAATTLLEAIELLAPDAERAARRADRPVRGGRALARTPRGCSPAAGACLGGPPRPLDGGGGACRSSSRSTGSTSSTSSRRSTMGRERAGDGSCARRPRADRRGRRPRSASARRRLGASTAAREHREEARAEIDRLVRRGARATPRRLLLPRLGRDLPRALRRRRRPHRARDRDRAGDRRRAAAGSADAGQELPARDARDAWPRRSSAARRRSRRRGCRPTRTTSSGRCSSSAGRATSPATSTARSRRARRACQVDRRLAGGTIPNGGGGPGWGLGVAWFDAGEVERASQHPARARRRGRRAHDAGRALLRLGEPDARRARGRGRRGGRRLRAPRRGGCGAARACSCPPALAGRARAAVLLARGEPVEAARAAARSAEAAAAIGARLAGGVLAQRSQGRALAAAGERAARRSPCCARPSASSTRAARSACATRRGASCASSARAPRRAGRRAGESGLASLTKRELEIADARHRPHDEQRDRRRALPQREDGRVAPAQHLHQARRLLPRRGRARGRARAARREARSRRELGRRPPIDPTRPAWPSSATSRSSTARLRIFDNAAIGFAAISPVVGLYAVVLVGTRRRRARPGSGCCRSRSPASACCSPSTRSSRPSSRSPAAPTSGAAGCMGGGYGWFSGWVAICAYAVANTTIAYLGAPWALTLLGIELDAERDRRGRDDRSSSSARSSARSASTCSAGRSRSGSPPRRSRRSGSGWRCCSSSATRTSRSSRTRSAPRRSPAAPSAPGCSPRSPSAAGCSSASTPASASPRRRAARRATSRARSGSRCSASAALVMLTRSRSTLAHPNPADVVAGRDVDPVVDRGRHARSGRGRPSRSPPSCSTAFLACGMAAQALTARTIYSVARDGVLPGIALPAHGRPAPGADRRDRRHHRGRLPRACCSA